MALWRNPRVLWRGTNIKTAVRSAAVSAGTESVDDTGGAGKARSSASGLKTFGVSLELNWAAGSTTGVDSLFGSTNALAPGVTGALVIRPTTSAISASNPEYTATMRVASYEFGGPIGDQHTATVDLQLAADNFTRAVST